MSKTPAHILRRITQAKRNKVKTLDLSAEFWWPDKYRLTTLPPEVLDLADLEAINLTANKITHIPEQIGRLSNLREINLYANDLVSVPEGLRCLAHLSKANLSANKLAALPEWLVSLPSLRSLAVVGNPLLLPRDILHRLARLTELDAEIPGQVRLEDLAVLENLEALALRVQPEMPPSLAIAAMKGLRRLEIFGGELPGIPPWVAELKQLVHLRYGGARLESIPPALLELKQLESLALSVTDRFEPPDWLTESPRLRDLNLEGAHWAILPSWIRRLRNLRVLTMIGGGLEVLPPWFEELGGLARLNLSSNKLRSIPPEVFSLSKLVSLWLYKNEISEVPSEIASLKSLEAVSLGANAVRKVPDCIADLPVLRMLKLFDNAIDEFPAGICQIRSLEAIDLSNQEYMKHASNNSLRFVPPEVLDLPWLRDLDVRGNPLESPPPEVAKEGWPAIMSYLEQLQAKGQDQLYEAKLLIVGEPGAGKTTLVKKVINPNYQLEDSEVSTQGINVYRWDFQTPHNKSFRANIWDFGGQEIYHATHQFFLTKRSVYTLVADTRKEDTDFFYWLNIVELLSDDSPLIIVKNEKQDRHRDINERQLRGRFTNLKEIIATNLATNRDLEKVRAEIRHHLCQLPHIGSTLPKTWVKVREAMEKDGRNYIPLDEYLALCSRHGFTETSDKLQLSGYLHDLGVCLHYQDDPLLRKIVILNPQWGTDAVYRVLDNKDVIRNLGKFTRVQLASIWTEPQYATMLDELLQLMIRFRLCYRLPSQADAFIAPQLLSHDQPHYDWTDTGNLHLRYEYDFMPKGILTQFIVAVHAMIEKETCAWRTGVVLERDSTRAEVIENYYKRQIRIRISGKHKRDLLTIVTYELDRIHSSFQRLKCTQLIPCNCPVCASSTDPHFYDYQVLRKFIDDKRAIQCQRSYAMIDPQSLIDDVRTSEVVPPTRVRSKVFISYSHKDREWLGRLQEMLKPLTQKREIIVWADTDIRAGARWKEAIRDAVDSAKVTVLLVSPSFLASDFITESEVPPILKAAAEQGLTILWVPLSDCLYAETSIADFQATYDPSTPLDSLGEAEVNRALVKICKAIAEAAK